MKAKKYIVQVKIRDGWYRSANAYGKYTKEGAQRRAKTQEKESSTIVGGGLKYRIKEVK